MGRILMVLCALLCCGCQHQASQKIVAKVNNYYITQQEFDEAYKNSSFNPSLAQTMEHHFKLV